ncbi:hypothetical protein Cch02nite_83100 [Catellatospora chokoriensis]|uniref:Uncharacterized protein n=1 Tax=Catellatospora chokoriensis TaxID=310353 RepID=A0A8J3K184_9ACTN|nr:hypothetical protein Cch02nite_83100 [Catellatospora chokoriensis]
MHTAYTASRKLITAPPSGPYANAKIRASQPSAEVDRWREFLHHAAKPSVG